MPSSIRPVLALLVVSACWGFTFPVIKGALAYVSAEVFVSARFALAALFLLPMAAGRGLRSRQAITAGACLGLLNGAVYLLLTESLQYISASRCAFLVGANVILVPLLSHGAGLSRLRLVDLASAVCCLTGLFCLTGADLHSIGRGDLLMLGCETIFAFYLVLLSLFTRRGVATQPLTFYQVVFTVPMPLLWVVLAKPRAMAIWHPHVGYAVVFCALAATVIPLLLQTQYQHRLSPPTAALLLALEPVFAALFAHFVFAEPITAQMLAGAGLMLMAAMLPQMWQCVHPNAQQSARPTHS